MTVAELIEHLKGMPQHHPVLCHSDLMRHPESISLVRMQNLCDSKIGPVVTIHTADEPKNYDDHSSF